MEEEDMRTRQALAGMAGAALLALLTASLGRADFLHGFWEWATGQPPKQPAGSIAVSEVVVFGSHFVPARTVLAQVKTRPGGPLSLPVVEEDVNTLRASRQFASVRVELREDGPGRVKVCFFLRDLAQRIEKVTYVGARQFTENDLAALTGIRAGSAANPELNRLACRKIVERYNEAGRPFTTCSLLKGGGAADTEVIFSITEGPEVLVRDVRFEGNNLVGSPVLADRIRSGISLQANGGKYDSGLAEADAGEVVKYYRSLGYDRVGVSRELKWDESGRSVSLVFHIDEGVRYKIADLPAKPAAPVADAGSGIRLAARESAAPAAPAIESPSVKIGKIHVAGNRVTPSALVVAQSGLAPGQVVSEATLRKAEQELAKIKLFEVDPARRPTVTVLDSEGEVRDLLIYVKEKDAD
jgi:outer membrane protein assembly factor BamA